MARTKQEIRDFLNSQVGKRVNWKCGLLNGQCVSLIKALMEFLGVSNPYKARGHARDAGNNYINQGIGKPGRGWLTICVGKSSKYGHIWIDLMNEANYEQNLNGDLRVHKNTRPISQASQFVNFDKWVKADQVKPYTPKKAVYGTSYINNDPMVGKIAAFMYKTFPSYTKKDALGNYFGPNLTKAVKEFQRRTGLEQDGNVGPITMAKLKSYGFKG